MFTLTFDIIRLILGKELSSTLGKFNNLTYLLCSYEVKELKSQICQS